LLLPYRVDVPMHRWPIANFVIIGLSAAVYFYQRSLPTYEEIEFITGWATDGWGLKGLFGSMWVHVGFWHLFGNMVFLWVFGNAVCAKMGNVVYALVYVGLGLAATAAHLVFDGAPAVGASGAINGVVGAYLVFYPRNDVSCLLLLLPWVRTFSVSSIWIILLFLGFDVLGAYLGWGGTAYAAHLGGFAAGFALAALGLIFRLFQMERDEQSIFTLFSGPHVPQRHRAMEAVPERRPTPPEVTRGPATMMDLIEGKNAAAEPPPAPARQSPGRPSAPSQPTPPRPPPVPPSPSQPGRPPAAPSAPADDDIRVVCGFCSKALRAPSRFAGRQIRCPNCRQVIELPWT